MAGSFNVFSFSMSKLADPRHHFTQLPRFKIRYRRTDMQTFGRPLSDGKTSLALRLQRQFLHLSEPDGPHLTAFIVTLPSLVLLAWPGGRIHGNQFLL